MHDYFCGMICLRDGGAQMPDTIKKYSNKGIYAVYNVFLCLLLLLVGAVFVYTPGDIAATQVFGFSGLATDWTTWVIYGVIFLYYLLPPCSRSTPSSAVSNPIFGAILLFSAVGVFVGIFAHQYPLIEVWDESWANEFFDYGAYFGGVSPTAATALPQPASRSGARSSPLRAATSCPSSSSPSPAAFCPASTPPRLPSSPVP